MDKELLDKLNTSIKKYYANYGEKMAKMTPEEQDAYHKSIPDMGGALVEEMLEVFTKRSENLSKINKEQL
jgi:hypothetical protein